MQPTSTPVAPASSQPPAPPGLRGGLTPATPVPLARAAETVEHVLRMASARGVTQARIALHPAELGSIDIHLRHTAEGVMARVVAHTGEATQALQQAASDLRRALEEQGVKLLGLDIGQSGDERAAGRSGGDPGAQARGGGDTAGSAAAGDATGTETSTDESIRLPNGVLVDVLA